ncbi:Glycosyl hydrolase family 20, catalytic domain [Botrimarina colliarenosi]|uniref:Glycosyl hydrolase family 20, catalytic domain n=1 Tax=Botrimarina colliarenosi TaxID=2528001 RepID=A0A5C6AED6_9BACT|nr:family 20 glycosylhydrolase [Botrimarina colliarenosi]TWT97545.1 Glycosyl hydrolase family 20, catalytic domain [Botrimarina colliarenosi]
MNAGLPNASKPVSALWSVSYRLAGVLLLAWIAAPAVSAETSAVSAEAKPLPIRAVHIDNRIQVLPVAELKRLATDLSERDINTLIMEWEASFPFDKHHIISNRYAYTREEIAEFIEHCKSVGIDVVPLQQCIGHLEYVLRYERYAELREDDKDISQVCPSKKELTVDLYDDLLTELVASHPSKYVHIGADETALLGHCETCRRVVERDGKSALFMDHIASIAECVQRHGKTPVLWADIVMRYPEAIDKLPRGCVLVNWNYGWDVDYFGDHDTLTESGLELWGAPAMRSHPDNFYRFAWDTHFKNFEDFIPFMREQGYRGVVLTSWSTSGVYTASREPKTHVIGMTPSRRVYPMRGFPLLIDAFAEAIARDRFNAHDYVVAYCRDNYGLSESNAEAFWGHLNESSNLPTGDASTRGEVLSARDRAEAFSDFLSAVTFRSEQEHLEHYRLMNDIRRFFIDVQLARLDAEYSTSDPAAIDALTERFDRLRGVADEIGVRFAELHQENLYPAAIEAEAKARTQELETLSSRIGKRRRLRR